MCPLAIGDAQILRSSPLAYTAGQGGMHQATLTFDDALCGPNPISLCRPARQHSAHGVFGHMVVIRWPHSPEETGAML